MDAIDLRYILDILWIGLFLYLLYGYAALQTRIRNNEKAITDHLMDIHTDMALHGRETKTRLKHLESMVLPISSVKVLGGKTVINDVDTTMPFPPGTDEKEN